MNAWRIRVFRPSPFGEPVEAVVKPCPRCKVEDSALSQHRQYSLGGDKDNRITSLTFCRMVCADCGYKTDWVDIKAKESLYWSPQQRVDDAEMAAIDLWNTESEKEEA